MKPPYQNIRAPYQKRKPTAYKKGVATPVSELELIKRKSRSPSAFSIDYVNKG